MQINDITGTSPEPYSKFQTYEKNRDLLRDSILGKKKWKIKENNPLDPSYVVRTVSGRKQIISTIDKNKPEQKISPVVNRDTKRYMKTNDISGASPRVHALR